MKYKCVKEFFLEKYDEDGFVIENKYIDVKVGSEWKLDTVNPNLIAGNDCVHLDKVVKSRKGKIVSYLEITREHLAEYFEQMAGENE